MVRTLPDPTVKGECRQIVYLVLQRLELRSAINSIDNIGGVFKDALQELS
jgi:hypothetical protein